MSTVGQQQRPGLFNGLGGGLMRGILIGGLKLNALIVTLAMGQIVIGIVSRYVRMYAFLEHALDLPAPPEG